VIGDIFADQSIRLDATPDKESKAPTDHAAYNTCNQYATNKYGCMIIIGVLRIGIGTIWF